MSHRPTLSDPPAPGAFTLSRFPWQYTKVLSSPRRPAMISYETHVDESPCFTFTTLPLPQWCRLTGADFSGPFESSDNAIEDAGDLGGQF